MSQPKYQKVNKAEVISAINRMSETGDFQKLMFLYTISTSKSTLTKAHNPSLSLLVFPAGVDMTEMCKNTKLFHQLKVELKDDDLSTETRLMLICWLGGYYYGTQQIDMFKGAGK